VIWLALAAPAHAYPWMVHHGYTSCGECHVDPSGAGVLTPYGRAQGVVLLASPWGERGAEWQPGKGKDFAFGAIDLPKAVALQADVRTLLIPDPANLQVIAMQDDLRGAVTLGRFVAYGSIGAVSAGAEKARITSGDGANLVSRQHWVGVTPVEGLLVRAGSLDLPYGIRSEDHILFGQSLTRTDLDDGQEYGLDVFYQRGKVRVEAMAVAGDLQVHPAIYREHGYVASVGWSPRPNLDLGLSSLALDAGLDVGTRRPLLRTANAAHARWAPVGPLAVLGEAGVLLEESDGRGALGGYGSLQLDLEPTQGFHVRGTVEGCHDAWSTAPPTSRGWLTTQWFVAPHVDLRADALYGTLYCTPGAPRSFMGLLQAHAYL
jgi:hypothetical protein